MAVSRAWRWLTICSIAGWAACGSGAPASRTVAAPAAAPTPPAVAAPVEPPAAPAEPPAALAEPPAPAPPPAAEPVAALPPCPGDRSRDWRQKPDHVMQLAELATAMTVVDLGSGDGYFLCHLSRAVGATGRVVATEVSNPLVRGLKSRVAREQLANVEVIHAPTTDVGVAPGTADRILLVNVWHHISDRKRYATRVARALSPTGKVVIIDFKPATRGAGHGIMPERVIAELAAGGIDGTVVADELPDQFVIIGSVRR